MVTSLWNSCALAGRAVNFDAVIQPFVTRYVYTARGGVSLGRAECADLTETPSGVNGYFFSGYNLMLRKNTSAPSDWNKIFPLGGNACEPSLANFPLTNCLT